VRADVVVVGAGPAGSSAAFRLARSGFDVILVDRSRFPRDKPCGEFLSPGATPILEELGVRPAIEAAGASRIGRVRIVIHGRAVELVFPDDLGIPPWGFSLSRLALDAVLLDAARRAGARVLEETRVEDVRIEPGEAVVLARGPGDDPLALEARVVVGAGGRNCPVARVLGLQRRGRRGRFDLLAHWAERPLEAEESAGEPACELRVRGDSYVAIAPVERGRWNVNCVVPRAALQAEPRPDALYRRVVGAEVSPVGGTAGDVVASDVTALHARAATADRAILIGDAALFLDPFTGQGIWLALRSAALAAATVSRALATGRADRAALAGYEVARRDEFDARRRVSRALQGVLFRPRLARAVVEGLRRDPRLGRSLAAATGDMTSSETVWSAAFALRLLGGFRGR
jgi:geranylgeranyl reductase family protein